MLGMCLIPRRHNHSIFYFAGFCIRHYRKQSHSQDCDSYYSLDDWEQAIPKKNRARCPSVILKFAGQFHRRD
jgi:hypothetical protein